MRAREYCAAGAKRSNSGLFAFATVHTTLHERPCTRATEKEGFPSHPSIGVATRCGDCSPSTTLPLYLLRISPFVPSPHFSACETERRLLKASVPSSILLSGSAAVFGPASRLASLATHVLSDRFSLFFFSLSHPFCCARAFPAFERLASCSGDQRVPLKTAL